MQWQQIIPREINFPTQSKRWLCQRCQSTHLFWSFPPCLKRAAQLQLHPECVQGSRKSKWERHCQHEVSLCQKTEMHYERLCPKSSDYSSWTCYHAWAARMASIGFLDFLEGGRKREGFGIAIQQPITCVCHKCFTSPGYIWAGREKLRKEGCSEGHPQSWILWKVCWETTFKKIYMVAMIPSTAQLSDLLRTCFSWPSFQVLSLAFMSDTWVVSKSPGWPTIKLHSRIHTYTYTLF